jgi:hypothetical protein
VARVEWDDLPSTVRVAVGARVGAVLGAVPVEHGLTCRTAAVLTTPDGRVFAKGVPTSDRDGVVAQDFEVAVNPHVAGVSPLLLARVTVAGWDMLLFEHIPGRHADLSPGSPDIEPVTEALRRVQGLQAGGLAPRLTDRLDGHLDDAEQALLAGDALLHADTNPHNILIADGRAHLVDWAMVAAGPAWVDVACLAVRLMEADWAPADALAWAAQFASWRDADPVAVRVFVEGTCRAWEARIGPSGAVSSNRRFQALLAGARAAA